MGPCIRCAIPPVNGLVVAYKFTGDRFYLELAWTRYTNWQAARSGTTGQLENIVDSQIASATGFRFLSNNKGELQYVYALFENGGEPLTIATETIEYHVDGCLPGVGSEAPII